jgi:hypothetical protein
MSNKKPGTAEEALDKLAHIKIDDREWKIHMSEAALHMLMMLI